MSSFGCPTSMQFSPAMNQFVGKDSKTGQSRVFQTLNDYSQFLSNLEKRGTHCPDVSVPDTRPAPFQKYIDTPTGFLEFKPDDPELQSRVDPMSAACQGHSASDKAIKQGLFRKDQITISQNR